MRLKVASYNIHKAVGLDRRHDPDRIVGVLHELDADVIALQEVDRRFGAREAVIPHALVEQHGRWCVVAPSTLPRSMGWHGNALLVRSDIAVDDLHGLALPALEPRGAVCATLRICGRTVRVAGMHLDLSGLRRRAQVRAVRDHLFGPGDGAPAIALGDMNDWAPGGGALRAFAPGLRLLAPGRSYPARRPLAMLDRIVVSAQWQVESMGVHRSVLASVASDHLPVWANLTLTALHKF